MFVVQSKQDPTEDFSHHMNCSHWVSRSKFVQPEYWSNDSSHRAPNCEPFLLFHPLKLRSELCERQSLWNASTHQSPKNALVKEMSCKVHSWDCSHDENKPEDTSCEVSQWLSVVHAVLNDRFFNRNQHHEQETGCNHHVAGWGAGWGLACSLRLIKCRTS